MRTFSIHTLGCRVNHYESEQIAAVLKARGLQQVDSPDADLRVINTCSVTAEAASKSRQLIRRGRRLPVLAHCEPSSKNLSDRPPGTTIVTGCWATSNPHDASQLPGVAAVINHHEDVADQLNRFLDGQCLEPGLDRPRLAERRSHGGTTTLPLLHDRQSSHQRAFLKIQDGCDAFCTYCIIPTLRPSLWSKPVGDCVEEAQSLVDAGHAEIVLTGIFLGAYGQSTALRRRQKFGTAEPLARLVEALCTQVRGLHRLRLSSLEPGDLTDELADVLASHKQIVPHFHLPLQSGSDEILRLMNRQYRVRDYLEMLDRVHARFDRAAITTDIIVGFPGETGQEFMRTLEVVDRARFVHIHAFVYSPRPGTAAARWTSAQRRPPEPDITRERMRTLQARAHAYDLAFRQQFVGECVEVLVERSTERLPTNRLRSGRCERYFEVHFHAPSEFAGRGALDLTGALVELRIDRVSEAQTLGTLVRVRQPARHA